jgi:16S rRNA (uracil1498-N3)-methyltransferase
MGHSNDGEMKPPPRFAIASPASRTVVRVAGPEAHHMRDVMRLRPGDAVTLIDEKGTAYSGTIAGFDRDGAEVRIGSIEEARLRPPLVVAPAIVKGARMDFIVEKAAELGATELWPIVTARTVGKPHGVEKTTRWRRLAAAASKQSLALPPMIVSETLIFHDLIHNVPRDTLALICSAGAEPISEAIAQRRPLGLLIALGPEGDFEPVELEQAIAAGFVAVGLGPNRLRSETAAIAALAIAAQWTNRQTV